MSIVTVEELRDYMSGIFLEGFGQYDATQQVIDGIQADLERYLHRPLEPRVVTERVEVMEDGYLRTTQPVDGLPDGSPLQRVGGRLYAGSLDSILYSTTTTLSQWFTPYPLVTVTYITGVDASTDPEYADVRLAIMRVASREVTNRHDDTLSVKGLSTANDGEPTGPQNGVQGWTMDELRMFDRLRKRVIA